MADRLVFVNRYFHPDHSATSQLLSDLLFSINLDDVQVEVVTSRMCYSEPSVTLPPEEVIHGIYVHRIWTTRFGRGNLVGRSLDYLSFYLSAFMVMLHRYRKYDLLVAKTDPPLISVIVMLVCRLRGARYINWIQDLFPEVANELGVRLTAPLTRLLTAIRNSSLRRAEMNVVISDRMGAHVLANGVEPERVRVIHNWSIDDSIEPLAREKNPLRERWGLGLRFVVGYSGNMGRSHEFDTLLDAADRLRYESEICFLFVGAGAKLDYIREQAASRGLANILFKDYQPVEMLRYSLTLPDLHCISLVPALEGLVVPSKFYGIIASGRPVLYIGDRTGDIASIVIANDCGAAYEIGDVDGVVDYLRALAADLGRANRAGRRARKMYDERFSREVPRRGWSRLLAELNQP